MHEFQMKFALWNGIDFCAVPIYNRNKRLIQGREGLFMAVTIKEVAALAGVSPSTVSRTCNNHSSISEETKEKVRRAMQQLGYDPGPSASALGQQETIQKTIGIILPPSQKETYENAFYLEAVRGISQFCNSRRYISAVITGQDEQELFQGIQTMVQQKKVDGFILLYVKNQDPILEYLYNEGVLYVLIGKAYQYVNQTIYIDNDNFLAGQEATEYLLGLGHEKIAYLGSESSFMFSADRKAGYQMALGRHHIPLRPEYCLELSSVPRDNPQILRRLLESPDRPTAMVASDDIFALALKQVCLEVGLSIPEDLSIISFNNSLLARITSPQLTSIDVNSCQLGIEAASQLINHIENPNLMATKIIVPHQIVERDSCGACAR